MISQRFQRFDDGSEAPTELCREAQGVVHGAIRQHRHDEILASDRAGLGQAAAHPSNRRPLSPEEFRNGLVLLIELTGFQRPTWRARLRRGWHRLLSVIFRA